MAVYYYYRYNCQICGKRTKTRKSGVKDFKPLTCHVCHKVMCYKCSIGGFCKSCIDSLPNDIGKPYEKKAKILKIIHYSYFCIILLCCLLFVNSFLFILISYSIYEYLFLASIILVVYLCCPGLIIHYVVVFFIEPRFSDRGAKKLLAEFHQKRNFFN